MKFAVNIPNFGYDIHTLIDFARDTESAGWDGFFIWDHIAREEPSPMLDVTVALTAIASNTKRIRFGAMVTALPRRRPSKFARETATLDQLSGGRLITGFGIGVSAVEFGGIEPESTFKERAAMLDEGLEVLTKLWSGELISHHGDHYNLTDQQFLPTPVQQPRIPIWIAGMWPNKPPFRRAAQWDGIVAIPKTSDPLKMLSAQEVAEIVAYIKDHRQTDSPFDVCIDGFSPGDFPAKGAEISGLYHDVGVTWWQEKVIPARFGWQKGSGAVWPLEQMRERIQQGPPRIR